MNRRNALKLGAGTALAGSLVSGLTGAQEGSAAVEQETTTVQEETTTVAGPEVPESVFLAGLTGSQEVPPVETSAGGSASFAYDSAQSSLVYALLVADIENVVQAHIHQGAPGENGEVVAWLYPSPDEQSSALIEGEFDGLLARGEITDEHLVGPLEGESIATLLSLMAAGEAYVNVHTEQNPQGEIRGQILTLDDLVACVPVEPTTVAETTTEVETPTPTEEPTPTETPTPTPTPEPAAETTTESG